MKVMKGQTVLAHGFAHVGEQVLELPAPSPLHDTTRILIVRVGRLEIRITESEATLIAKRFADKY